MRAIRSERGSSLPVLLIIILLVAAVSFYYRQILTKAGEFLAPSHIQSAEAVVIEGSRFIDRFAMTTAKNLLDSGKVRQIVIVIHDHPTKEALFAFPYKYDQLVRKEMSVLKIKKNQYQIITTPTQHPVTLNEARQVLTTLSKQNIHKVALLVKGFHTRRSCLAYQHVGLPLKIKIIPVSYFTDYPLDQWWLTENGFREFVSEALKLVYYQIRGYIPWKLSHDDTEA